MSDLRQLADELAVLDGAGSDARKAVEGLETSLDAMESGVSPTGIEWISAFRDAGAYSCWQIFQGAPTVTE